jgi:hypothetical protein
VTQENQVSPEHLLQCSAQGANSPTSDRVVYWKANWGQDASKIPLVPPTAGRVSPKGATVKEYRAHRLINSHLRK